MKIHSTIVPPRGTGKGRNLPTRSSIGEKGKSAPLRQRSPRKQTSGSRVGMSATAAIRHLKTSQSERNRHQDRTARLKSALQSARLPVMPSDTHIVPVHVGDPERCRTASDLLLYYHGIYIQPINYPTVARGSERLRITPSPHHDDTMIARLVEALADVWDELRLPRSR